MVSVELASDADFQAWVERNGLLSLIDENGIAEWTFDDRVRTINFALRKGIVLELFEPENNSINSSNNSDEELFDGDKPASQAKGA